ncbi:hypothetical protein C8J56DRAFT_1032950 [Mycena floridula]|nr:hypothetical protein C8J56DRAFT_1032950 [Mycena floridula]
MASRRCFVPNRRHGFMGGREGKRRRSCCYLARSMVSLLLPQTQPTGLALSQDASSKGSRENYSVPPEAGLDEERCRWELDWWRDESIQKDANNHIGSNNLSVSRRPHPPIRQ